MSKRIITSASLLIGLVLTTGTSGQELDNCFVRSPRAEITNFCPTISPKLSESPIATTSTIVVGSPSIQGPDLEATRFNSMCYVHTLRADPSNFCQQ